MFTWPSATMNWCRSARSCPSAAWSISSACRGQADGAQPIVGGDCPQEADPPESRQLREAGDDMFLIDDATGGIHHLNTTGAALWRLLAEPITLREIVEVFREAFPGRTRRLMKKLKEVLDVLEANALLGNASWRAPAGSLAWRPACPDQRLFQARATGPHAKGLRPGAARRPDRRS